MKFNGNNFRQVIDHYGELHVYYDDQEYHVHRHDINVREDVIHIDSKMGDWTFPHSNEINVEYPHSHKE